MKLLEMAFTLLINAFDDFIRTEEQELGCLSNKQHSDFIAMRNYIDDVYIEKTNKENPKQEKEKEEKVSLMYVPCLDSDDDAVEAHKKKRLQEMEL